MTVVLYRNILHCIALHWSQCVMYLSYLVFSFIQFVTSGTHKSQSHCCLFFCCYIICHLLVVKVVSCCCWLLCCAQHPSNVFVMLRFVHLGVGRCTVMYCKADWRTHGRCCRWIHKHHRLSTEQWIGCSVWCLCIRFVWKYCLLQTILCVLNMWYKYRHTVVIIS